MLDLLKLKFLRPLAPYMMLLLRIAFGLIMMNHGWAKFQDVAGPTGFFGSLGIPAPGAAAWLVTIVELVGGLCVLLGVLPRLWSLLFAITMVVAILLAKLPSAEGFLGGFEFEFLLLFVALFVAVKGGGSPALGPMLGVPDDDD